MILKIILGVIFLALVIVDFKQEKYSEAIVITIGLVIYTILNVMPVIIK